LLGLAAVLTALAERSQERRSNVSSAALRNATSHRKVSTFFAPAGTAPRRAAHTRDKCLKKKDFFMLARKLREQKIFPRFQTSGLARAVTAALPKDLQ
jgi:hypothetical protein